MSAARPAGQRCTADSKSRREARWASGAEPQKTDCTTISMNFRFRPTNALPRQVCRQLFTPGFGPGPSQRSDQPNSRLSIARAFPLDALLHNSRRRSIPTSVSVWQGKATAARFLRRHCDLPHLVCSCLGARRSSRPTMTGLRASQRRPECVGVGAAAQRLCEVGFRSGFMVAAAASPESHEGSG